MYVAKEANTHMRGGGGKKNCTGNIVLGSEGTKGGEANKDDHLQSATAHLDQNVQISYSVQILLA